MLTDKEFVLIRTQTANRAEAMRSARQWADPANRSGTYKARVYDGFVKSAVKNARKANRKIVAAKAAGSARPVSVVLAAVLPLMEGFATAAADRMTTHIAKVRAQVKAEGLDVAFPEPVRLTTQERWNRVKVAQYDAAVGRRSFAERVCGLVERVDAEEFATREIETAVFFARSSFLSYAWKLDSKVGDVIAARLETVAGVWGESYLHVQNAAGNVTKWKTQTITNYSVYGTPYFQWPTRIVKM